MTSWYGTTLLCLYGLWSKLLACAAEHVTLAVTARIKIQTPYLQMSWRDWTIWPGTRLSHWGRDKMAANFLMTFSNAFFSNENIWIPIKISLKFVPKGPINNISALVQIMAWCRPGDTHYRNQLWHSLLTHICVTRPQWVNFWWPTVIYTLWNKRQGNLDQNIIMFNQNYAFENMICTMSGIFSVLSMGQLHPYMVHIKIRTYD